MVLRHNARGAGEELDAAQNLLAMQWMLAHAFPLFFSELGGLAQNCIGHANLSDVMKQRAEFKRLHLCACEAILATKSQTKRNHTFRVTMRLRVPCFQSRSQRLQSRAISVLERAERFLQFRRALCYQIFAMILVMSLGYVQFITMEHTCNGGISRT